jgi:hypothetical protein
MGKWISVKDRLPDENEIVLLYFELNGIKYIEKGWLDPDYAKGLEAFGMHMTFEEYQDKITHWMPLPKYPDIRGDDENTKT